VAVEEVFGAAFEAESALRTGTADVAFDVGAVLAYRADSWHVGPSVLAHVARGAAIALFLAPFELESARGA